MYNSDGSVRNYVDKIQSARVNHSAISLSNQLLERTSTFTDSLQVYELISPANQGTF